MENDAEIFPAHYTWKVAEKGFKMASMMNKLAMINSCEIILEKYNTFFLPKIIVKFRCALYLYVHYMHYTCMCIICTILVCALYSIKYGTFLLREVQKRYHNIQILGLSGTFWFCK